MHGYRNVYYNPREGLVKIWTWDASGNRIVNDISFKPYIYVESQNIKDATSIYNTPLRKVEFKNQWERRNYVKESGIKRVFYNIGVEQQCLIDTYLGFNSTPDFGKFPLKIFYLDIETYSPNEFPNPKIAADPINLITIYDSLSNQYYVWGLEKDYTGKQQNIVYHKCLTETEVLKGFIKYWTSDYPDIVTSWNGEGFDIPYLIARITNMLGEDWAKKLSPVDNIYCREGIIKRFGRVETKWFIKGVSLLDYLEVYKVFSKEQRESYALNNIGEIELGEGKLNINATSLTQLANTDWDNFVDYNIQDVTILIKLEDKLRFLQICRMLGYLGLAPLESTLGTITIVTGAVALKAKERGLIIPTFSTEHRLSYEGGFVKEPDKGMKENVVSFDVNSLYPNTIVSLNISPETKLGVITSKTDTEIEIKLVSGKDYKLPIDKFIQFVEKEKIAISKAKTLYTQKVKGIIPELVEGIYAERVKNKKLLKEHKIAIKHCKENTDKYKEHKRLIDHLDIVQYSLGKILMNRIYGTFANKHSPFCDIDAASSITLTGQNCVKTANNIINEYTKTKFNIVEDVGIYSDTDSVVGSTQIRTNIGIIPIKDLFTEFNKRTSTEISKFGHEMIKPKNLQCLTYNSTKKQIEIKPVKKLIRHKTTKKLYRIVVNGKEIITTEDHGLMVLRDEKLIRISPKDLKKDDKMINMV